MKRWKRASPWLAIGASLVLGCAPGTADEEPEEGDSLGVAESAIGSGITVSNDMIRSTGSVRAGGSCSGMLVTPNWVITAAHCAVTVGSTVAMTASLNQEPRALVAEAFTMPGFGGSCSPNDVKLLKLASPLYPVHQNGRTWEGYRRDIHRGSGGLPSGSLVDVYGWGCDTPPVSPPPPAPPLPKVCTGAGVLRYARFEVEPSADMLEFDGTSNSGFPNAQAFPGDSGSSVLTPGFGAPTASDLYRIAGVACGLFDGDFETDNDAAPAVAFQPFFDATIGEDWNSFDAPSQIFSSTLNVGLLN